MRPTRLGELEFDVLQFVSDHAPITSGEMTEQFGAPRGLARTTIHTVLERLRKKGYLTREMLDGAYRYTASAPASEALTDLVGDFLERSLQGSLKPFVVYLLKHPEVTSDELDDLKKLVKTLDQQKGNRHA